MSDKPSSLDDLRVHSFITPEKKLYVKASFNCPLCGERIEMSFTKADIKALLQGFKGRVYPR